MNGLLKKVIKSAIYRLASARSEDEILEKLKDKTVVSFDVFDTAVKRDVLLPTDIFALMEKKLVGDKTLQITDFASARIEAERSAWSRSGGLEITLADIYAQMPLTEEQRRRLMRLECETEIEASAPNIPIKRIYDACVREGKRVLFISDMYLPSQVIGEILRKSGYDPGHLYVSCEAGSNKRGGGLFSYVQKAEALKAESWAHIGDSIQGDFLAPKRLGIGSVLIERDRRYNKYVHKKLYRESLGYRQLNHFIDTRLPRYADPYERIGYAVLGPLLYGFSCWLEKEIPKDESIVFLAREGELLQKAFQIVSERPSVYLRVSRHALNSVFIDQVDDVGKVTEVGINPLKRFTDMGQWARIYGLSDSDIEILFRQNGLDENAIINDETVKRKLLQIIWPAAKKNAMGQFDLFRTYIKQLGIKEKAAAVDVGWRGTLQAFLSNIEVQVETGPISWRGYYFGVNKMGNEPPNDRYEKKAYLFSGIKRTHIQESIENSIQIFETLFLATDGTTKGYEAAADKVCPVLGPPDNNERVSDKITAMQNAGVGFVRDFYGSPAGKLCEMSAQAAVGNYEKMARVPTLETIKLFEQFVCYDENLAGFGVHISLGWYLCHPKRMLTDFAKACNKSWFLKSLFKLPLPYTAMITFARKVTDKKTM